MKADQFSKSILDLHPDIRFAGVIKSGHMYAYSIRSGIEEHLRERNPEISFKLHILLIGETFSAELGKLNSVVYSYDKVKMISVPVKEHVLVISAYKVQN